VADRSPQRPRVCAFHNHCRKSDPCDFDFSQSHSRNWYHGWVDGLPGTTDGWLRLLQFLAEAKVLIGLINIRVEQYEAAVTQSQKTHNQQRVSAPSQQPLGIHRRL
jgi:hypothetical protein